MVLAIASSDQNTSSVRLDGRRGNALPRPAPSTSPAAQRTRGFGEPVGLQGHAAPGRIFLCRGRRAYPPPSSDRLAAIHRSRTAASSSSSAPDQPISDAEAISAAS